MFIESVHIKEIKVGDTILHEGHLRTVCKNNIKKDSFFGTMIFGDSYKLGKVSVKRVIFLSYYAGRMIQNWQKVNNNS